MSKVQLSGNANGTGIFTIASPNSNTDRTLTLPDNTGTLLTQNSQPSFASTIGVGGATPANTGAGITFPATQSASSNANTLDDYEEGTWTPEMYFGGTLATAAGASGRYVKIGRQVIVTGQYALSNRNGGTSSCTLRGFPFNNTGTNEGDRGGAAIGYFNGFSGIVPMLMLDTGSTTATFRVPNGNDFDQTNVGVGSSVWFSYSYITGA